MSIAFKPKEGEVFASFVIGGSKCFTPEATVEITGTGLIDKFVKASGETTFSEEAQKHELEATSLHAYFENNKARGTLPGARRPLGRSGASPRPCHGRW